MPPQIFLWSCCCRNGFEFYHIVFALSRTFFKFFKTFCSQLSSRCGPRLLRRFHILPHLPALVKNFFRAFSNSFVPASLSLWPAAYRDGFTSYHVFHPLSRTFFDFFQNPFRSLRASSFPMPCPRGQLRHNTTPISLCQVGFSIFLRLFSPSRLPLNIFGLFLYFTTRYAHSCLTSPEAAHQRQ